MPIEGSKTQISNRNLSLDLGAYIQGKSFNRSVSISEAGTTDFTPSASDGSGSNTARRILSGGDVMSEPSPSPLSSATATISPESPPSSSVLSVSSASTHGFLAGGDTSHNIFASHTINDSVPQRLPTISVADTATTLSCCASTISSNPYTPEFTALFQNPTTHRTACLLSHLIDSRLSPEWRSALFIKSNSSVASTSSPTLLTRDIPATGSSCFLVQSNSVDTVDSAPLRRCVPPPTLSPSDEVAVTKRFKHSDDSESITESTNQTFGEPQRTSSTVTSSTSTACTSNTSFVSPRLVDCVCRLADHFESRYRDKLGDLLDDVARLSAAHVSSGPESATDTDAASPESNGIVRTNTELDDIHIATVTLIRSARCRFHQVLSELFRERINWGRVVAMFAFLRALCEHVERDLESQRYPEAGGKFIGEQRSASHNITLTPTTNTEGTGVPKSTEATDADKQPLAVATPSSVGNATFGPSLTISGRDYVGHFIGLRAAHYVTWTAEFVHGSHGIWDWVLANGGWEGLIKFESERGIHDASADTDGILTGFTEDDAMRLLRRAVTGVATLAVGAVGLVAALRYLSKRL